MPVLSKSLSFSGGVRPQDKQNKVSVIGGGDLGMASVISILSKVTNCTFYVWDFCSADIFLPAHIILNYNTPIMKCFFPLLIFIQCQVDKLVFIDVAESSTKGGSTDLEIFSLPKVEVCRGTSHSALSHSSMNVPLGWVIAVVKSKASRLALCWVSRSSMTHLYDGEHWPNTGELLCYTRPWPLHPVTTTKRQSLGEI